MASMGQVSGSISSRAELEPAGDGGDAFTDGVVAAESFDVAAT
jgi:hypothetical protein